MRAGSGAGTGLAARGSRDLEPARLIHRRREDGRRYEYELTPKGKDLATVMTALRQWGDRWVFDKGSEPLLVLDHRTGRPIPPVGILDESGAPISGRDLETKLASAASAPWMAGWAGSIPCCLAWSRRPRRALATLL